MTLFHPILTQDKLQLLSLKRVKNLGMNISLTGQKHMKVTKTTMMVLETGKLDCRRSYQECALAPYGQEYVAKAIEVTVLIEAERAVEDAAHLRQMVQGNAPEVLVEGARVQPLDATISADTVPAVENYPRPDRKDM
mmetsp:Transcript_11077/g.17776  ORF Transcript_11077/g.17776 Transcript_11077/m.17776 type:complete len:137 (+) Transcript_11077:107-517(+)